MIKFVYCIRKRAELTDEEFRNFWRDTHGPFIRSLAKTLRATKYIQSHTLNTFVNAEIVKSRGLDSPPYERHGFEKYCSIKINDTYSITGMWRDFVSNDR